MKGKTATEKDQYTFLFEMEDPKKHWQTHQMKKNLSAMQVRNSRFKYASNRLPVTPSIVSSTGSMWTPFPYLTSEHWCTDTTSPSWTLRFDLTTLFILIFGSSHVSSATAMQIVSFCFLPCHPVHQIEIKLSTLNEKHCKT